MGALNIREAALPHDLQAVRTLFVEYAESLDFSLCFQGFDDELAGLPGKYAPPAGRIWLAEAADGALAGCVAIRPIGEQDAEMKRLLRPTRFSGQGTRQTACRSHGRLRARSGLCGTAARYDCGDHGGGGRALHRHGIRRNSALL